MTKRVIDLTEDVRLIFYHYAWDKTRILQDEASYFPLLAGQNVALIYKMLSPARLSQEISWWLPSRLDEGIEDAGLYCSFSVNQEIAPEVQPDTKNSWLLIDGKRAYASVDIQDADERSFTAFFYLERRVDELQIIEAFKDYWEGWFNNRYLVLDDDDDDDFYQDE